jgi:excisionase family DNA binding protein
MANVEQKDTQDPARDWYTTQEAADYLRVSQPTIFRWMRQGTLSFYKVGSSTRFSREGLDSLIEKSTGQREAEAVASRCAACGHSILVEGQLQGTGRLYFRPLKTRFWVLSEGLVPTRSRVCAACGYIQLHADTQKLHQLSTEASQEPQPEVTGDQKGENK